MRSLPARYVLGGEFIIVIVNIIYYCYLFIYLFLEELYH